MAFALSSLFEVFFSAKKAGARIDCYHCGEKMRESNALMVTFHDYPRPVCCHGCLAVLKTIEKNGMVESYLHAKALQIEIKSQ